MPSLASTVPTTYASALYEAYIECMFVAISPKPGAVRPCGATRMLKPTDAQSKSDHHFKCRIRESAAETHGHGQHPPLVLEHGLCCLQSLDIVLLHFVYHGGVAITHLIGACLVVFSLALHMYVARLCRRRRGCKIINSFDCVLSRLMRALGYIYI